MRGVCVNNLGVFNECRKWAESALVQADKLADGGASSINSITIKLSSSDLIRQLAVISNSLSGGSLVRLNYSKQINLPGKGTVPGIGTRMVATFIIIMKKQK